MDEKEPKLPKWLIAKYKKFGGRKELTFKRWLRENYDGHCDAVEPNFGSSTGLADLFFVWGGRIIPVELKVGDFDAANSTIICSSIRSDQVKWHREMRALKVPTALFVDCGKFIGIFSHTVMGQLDLFDNGFKTGGHGVTVQSREDFRKSLNRELFSFIASY